MPAQRKTEARPGNRTSNAGPHRRFELQYEIDPDPGAEKDRQPQEAAVALGREAIAKAGEKACSRGRREADPFACDRRIRHNRSTLSEIESMVKNG